MTSPPSSNEIMKGSTMVTMSISVSAKPHKRSELLSALIQIRDSTLKESGCKAGRIYQEIDDANLINLEENWVHRTDLDTHLCSDIFGALLGAVKLLGEYHEIRINDEAHTEGMDAIKRVWSKHCK
jgi:quinol monooxygenase YgiN